MAQGMVHEVDFVWVLANISRAMSKQLAQKMLRSLFIEIGEGDEWEEKLQSSHQRMALRSRLHTSEV